MKEPESAIDKLLTDLYHRKLQDENTSLKDENTSLKNELFQLKSLLSDDHANMHVDKTAFLFAQAVFQRLIKKLLNENTRERYSEDMRTFAITVYGYSTETYR